MDVIEHIKQVAGDYVVEVEERNGELHLTARPEMHLELCRTLRDDPELAFDYPSDLAAYDTGEEMRLWYRLHSMKHNRSAILHLSLPGEEPSIASVTCIWPGMDWHERESFDLYGIRFAGHPDQEDAARMRILLPEDWEGHPFRKDYEPVFSGDPLHGPQETN